MKGLGFGILSRDENGHIWLTVTAEPEQTGLVIESLEERNNTIEGEYTVVRENEISILELIAMHQAENKGG